MSDPDQDTAHTKNYYDFQRGEIFRGKENAEVESIPISLSEEGNDDEDDQALYPW